MGCNIEEVMEGIIVTTLDKYIELVKGKNSQYENNDEFLVWVWQDYILPPSLSLRMNRNKPSTTSIRRINLNPNLLNLRFGYELIYRY